MTSVSTSDPHHNRSCDVTVAAPSVSRVIVVVLDGLRPDSVDGFDLHRLREYSARGAFTRPPASWPGRALSVLAPRVQVA